MSQNNKKKLRVCAKQIMAEIRRSYSGAASGKYRISWSEIQKQSFNILHKRR